MNYSTDIKFSNNLTKNGKTTITYSGSLFRTGSEAVTLVYGFGDNWEHTTEKEMTKNENNFSVEVDLLNYNKINFCFRNSNNIWDNNNYLNYIAPIEEPEEEYNFIINENLMPGILNNLFETDLSKCENTVVAQTQNTIAENENAIENVETVTQLEEQPSSAPIELVENSIVSEESFEIEIPEDDYIDIQEFMGEVVDEPTLTTDLELAFSENSDNTQDVKKEDIVNFDMDSLIDEILSPIIEAKTEKVQNYKPNLKIEELEDIDYNSFLEVPEIQTGTENVTVDNVSSDVETENVSVNTISSDVETENMSINNISSDVETENDSIDTISSDIENEIEEPSMLDDINAETSLVEVKESETSFLVSPRSLNKFYILKKRIKLAFYKLFTAIPKIIGSAFDEGKN